MGDFLTVLSSPGKYNLPGIFLSGNAEKRISPFFPVLPGRTALFPSFPLKALYNSGTGTQGIIPCHFRRMMPGGGDSFFISFFFPFPARFPGIRAPFQNLFKVNSWTFNILINSPSCFSGINYPWFLYSIIMHNPIQFLILQRIFNAAADS